MGKDLTILKGEEEMNHSTVAFSEYVEKLENALRKIADLEYCNIPGCAKSTDAGACRLCAAEVAEKALAKEPEIPPNYIECMTCHKLKHVNDFATPDECEDCFKD
jgi:hypothetical protein